MNYKILFFLLFLFLLSSCKNPLVIAHRGASGYLPEHTLESVALAHGMNPDFIEPDVVLTKDNELIVLHDIYLEHTTNVAQIFPDRIRKDKHFYAIDFTLAEIKKLSAFERTYGDKQVFPKRFPKARSSFKIPTLREWIELLQGLNKTRKKKIGIYVEFKSPSFHENQGHEIGKRLVEVLNEYDYNKMLDEAFVQCFEPEYLKKLDTKINKIQLLAQNAWKENDIDYDYLVTDQGLDYIASFAKGIGVHISHIMGSDLIERAHKKNLLVHVYTLRKDDYPKGYKTYQHFKNDLIKRGVDGFFTDFPDL